MEDKKDKHKSEISNTEWGLVIGALFTIDLVQWGLDFLVIGFVLNEFIDIFVGMSFAFYLLMKQQIKIERAIVLCIGYLGEAATDGVVPLWGLTGVYMYFNIKKKKLIGKVVGMVPGGTTVMKGMALKHRVSDAKTIYKTVRPSTPNDTKSVALSPQKNIQNNTQSVPRISSPMPPPQRSGKELARIPQNSDQGYDQRSNTQGERARETANPQSKVVSIDDRVKYQKYFKELGLGHETANLKDISSAARNLSKTYHPDKEGGDLYQQQKINAAYNELKELFH